MAARLLDGKRIADGLIEGLRARVQARFDAGLTAPGLAVVLVGSDPASAVYVRNKRRACERAGVQPFDFNLAQETAETALHALIDRLNDDDRVHGILVQLPLPPHMNATALINRIDPRKDVDGFHAENVGRLALRQPGLRPCTPRGIITLLAHTDQPVRGRNAVVIGVSNHVGRPMLMEMLIAGTTTSACHRFTPRQELQRQVAQADIVIAAVGRPGLVAGEWIKPGAVVIDVGITRLDDGSLVGDVEFDAARERASWITPVPGGVGPMTVATLIQNTVDAADALDAKSNADTHSP